MSSRAHSILIVGTGSIGERHLRCFLATERASVSFVEPRDELAQVIAERYPNAVRQASFEAALESGINGAVIATPAPLHLDQATQCVSKGISVLIEKPLSVSTDGLADFLKAWRSSNATAAVAYVWRTNPSLAAMREAFLSGKYGAALELIAFCGQNFPFYRPAYAQTYYANRSSGGGAVQDALTHLINAGEWLIGPVNKIVGDISHRYLANVNVEDTAHVLARHGEVPASYILNQYQFPNEFVISLVCEKAVLRFEAHHSRWRVMEQTDGQWEDHQSPKLERDAGFVAQANAFMDAIEKKQAPICSIEEAVNTLEVNLAILKSADNLQWEKIPQHD